MVRLKNIWSAALAMFHPSGHPDALSVEPGEIAEVPGELATEQPIEDAIVVEHADEVRLYPTAQWERVPGVDMDATPAAVPEANPAAPAVDVDATPSVLPPATTDATKGEVR